MITKKQYYTKLNMWNELARIHRKLDKFNYDVIDIITESIAASILGIKSIGIVIVWIILLPIIIIYFIVCWVYRKLFYFWWDCNFNKKRLNNPRKYIPMLRTRLIKFIEGSKQ